MTKHNTIQYNTLQYNTIQYNTITIQHKTTHYNTKHYNTIQHNITIVFCLFAYNRHFIISLNNSFAFVLLLLLFCFVSILFNHPDQHQFHLNMADHHQQHEQQNQHDFMSPSQSNKRQRQDDSSSVLEGIEVQYFVLDNFIIDDCFVMKHIALCMFVNFADHCFCVAVHVLSSATEPNLQRPNNYSSST